MAFNPSAIKSADYQPARTNLFDVLVTPPPQLQSALGNVADKSFLQFRVENIEFPGKNMLTADHKYYGPVNKIAYGASYVDLTMSVLVSEDYSEVEYFNLWQDLIAGEHRRTNRVDTSIYEPSYFDEYKSNVLIRSYAIRQKDQGNPTPVINRAVILQDTFPILQSPISLSWASQEVVKINVTFTYRYWKDIIDPPTLVTIADIHASRQTTGITLEGILSQILNHQLRKRTQPFRNKLGAELMKGRVGIDAIKGKIQDATGFKLPTVF